MESVASCTCYRNVCDGDGMVCIAVDRVRDIEENIWSPRYTYIHSGVHIGLSILSFQIRPQGEG